MGVLRLLFNLYPGEERKASLFIILALLWSIGTYGTFTLSEGMFLEHVGARQLPAAYLAIAVCMCLLAAILIFSLNRGSIRNLLFTLITVWIFTISLFYLLPKESAFFWYFFKVIGWVIPLSTYIVYWAFVDQYYDLQDGKRFFCLFNATIFLGDAIGGGIISFLLKPFGMEGVLLLFSATMALSLPFIFLISKKVSAFLEEHTENVDAPHTLTVSTIVKTVVKSKFTLYLLLFYFLMQLLAIVTEFNYMDVFEKKFQGRDTHDLTKFIGTCGMWISLANMFLAMLVYGRLVKKIGLNNMILMAPSLFMIVFVGWFCKDALPLAIMGMVAREGLSYTIDDNNLNLLISGVPSKIKYQIRISVESFIEPAGMFFASILLAFYQNAALLGLILAGAAFLIVFFLRKQYPKAIFRNLVSNAMRFEKKAADWIHELSKKEKKETEFLLLSHLKRKDEKAQLLAYEYLLKIGNKGNLCHLLNHIGKLSLPSKLKAVQLLEESEWAKENSVIERLDRFRRILPHPAIKSAIHFYFARHGLLRPERVLQDLHSEYLGLKAAAILSLRTTHHGLHLPSFFSLAGEKLKELLDSKEENEIATGLKILALEKNPENVELIFPYLKHPSLTINREAAKALAFVANVQKKEYALQIISRLSFTRDPEVRNFCLQAVEKFLSEEAVKDLILATTHFRASERKIVEQIVLKVGAKSAPTLLDILKENKNHARCRLLAGKILGQLDIKLLRHHLYKIIKQDIERAYFYFYHMKMIQKSHPEYELSVLENTLHASGHSIIDFIIQLIGVAGSITECEVLSQSLKSRNRKIRGSAIEALEKSCNAKTFQLLEPLIDERLSEEKVKIYLQKGGAAMDLFELLEVLSKSPLLSDQVVALRLKTELASEKEFGLESKELILRT